MYKLGIRLLIALAIGSFSLCCSASSWYFLWITTPDSVYFFDAESVEKNKDIVNVWVKSVQIKASRSDGAWSSATRWRYNCTKKTAQNLTTTVYDKSNVYMKTYSVPGAEIIAVPDTVADGMLKTACASNFPNDTSDKFYLKLPDNDVYGATKRYIEATSDPAPQ